MVITKTDTNFLSASKNDKLVAVKSNLVLLPDSEFEEVPQRKHRLQIVVNKRPSFHIGPEKGTHNEGKCCWKKCLVLLTKLTALLGLLYFFVASLNLLASAFRLIGGRTASAVFQNSELLSNPVVGLMIGVVVTVVVQSSSTSSSIIVSMVAAQFMSVQTAIPIIMGANIGTSITNTLVSFGQVNDREQFERAFAGAVVHDMFNFLSVLILLPLEVTTGYLNTLTKAVLSGFTFEHRDTKIELLSKITKPLTNRFVQIDKSVLEAWSLNKPDFENATLLKTTCTTYGNTSESVFCTTLIGYIGFGDLGSGILLLVGSLLLLCICLIGIVRLLSSMLKGSVALIVQRALNADLPYVPFLTGYLAILIGAIMTFMLQSSSIFTSSLTPLVGLGMISVERMYPLTLGSNLGTTATALLAALATDGSRIQAAIQIALVHFFFNLSGMIIFYPIPFMRFPIQMAKCLGAVTAKYRWFSALYMVFAFIILPLLVFSVSLGGPYAMYGIFIPLTISIILLLLINSCQIRCPKYLPSSLRSWHWLPKWLKSLEPLDNLITKCFCCQPKNALNPNYSAVTLHQTTSFDFEVNPGSEEWEKTTKPIDLLPEEIIVHRESVT